MCTCHSHTHTHTHTRNTLLQQLPVDQIAKILSAFNEILISHQVSPSGPILSQLNPDTTSPSNTISTKRSRVPTVCTAHLYVTHTVWLAVNKQQQPTSLSVLRNSPISNSFM